MMITYPLIEQYAQEQISVYESFLNTLHVQVVNLKSSGASVSAPDLKRVDTVFDQQAKFTTKLLAVKTSELLSPISGVPESIYFSWVGEVETALYKTFERCLIANRAKFKNCLRFGSSFDGLNNLVENYHGALGNVVQLLSTKINWTFRSKNGNSKSCARSLFLYYKLLASRAVALQFLYEHRLTDKTIGLCDKYGNVLLKGSAQELLEAGDIPERYFGFNEENYFVVLS